MWGPSTITSTLGHRYYVIFLDDYARFTWLFPLKQKSEVPYVFLTFKSFVENHFNSKIRYFQIDGGLEYKPLYTTFHQSGISLRVSYPYTFGQNG